MFGWLVTVQVLRALIGSAGELAVIIAAEKEHFVFVTVSLYYRSALQGRKDSKIRIEMLWWTAVPFFLAGLLPRL